MVKEIDLEEVNLTPEAVAAWHEVADKIGLMLAQLRIMGREIPEIPVERGRVEEDGTLTIFVKVPEVLEVSMPVPRGHWMWSQKDKNN